MPIYEYYCNECGGEFEVIQKISDRPKRKCELCGALKAKRKISQTSFVLKGQGWYATDYGNRGHPPAASSSGSGGSGKAADAAPEKPAEKPAEKKDSPPGKDSSAKKAS